MASASPLATELMHSTAHESRGYFAAASDSLSPTTPGTATPSTPGSLRTAANPLSSKVTSVLSAGYTDADFREGLQQLDERNVTNTAEARRHLRLDLQREVISSNGDIITEFSKVADQLRRIGHTVDALNRSYAELKMQMTTAHAATATVLDEASSLMIQRRQTHSKQELLDALRDNFILTEDEISALTLASEPVNKEFFAVLAKAKKISKDCELLLGFENQTLGLEIMEQTTKYLNMAFQKLYRWIQREFKALDLENPQIGSSIRHALRVLAERPNLFQNCLDFFAEAREHILSDAFYTALAGASTDGAQDLAVTPIEMAAHDPLRYVGDMLAWAHSTAVSEREALEVLFVSEGDEIAKGIQAGRENQVWRLVTDSYDVGDFDALAALNDLVDRDMSGATRILRQRVEQVIQTNEETILGYKLANLLGFYKTTFCRLLGGTKSVLVECLATLETEAMRQFRSLLRDHIATLQSDFLHTPADFSVPEFLQDALEQLTAILKSYETSFTALDDAESGFQPVLSEALDPFLSGSESMAKTLKPPSDSIFRINCLLATKTTLMPFDFTAKRVAQLQASVVSEAKKLIEVQYHLFQQESGLASLIAALAPLRPVKTDVEKLQSLASVQMPALAQASQILDSFLPSALIDGTENLKHLQDHILARDITEEAADKFCKDFEHVEEMLMLADELAEQSAIDSGAAGRGDDTEKAWQSLRALFPRTTGEIRVLLS